MPAISLGLDLDGVVFDAAVGFRTCVARELRVPESSLGPQTHWSLVESGWLESEEQFRRMHANAVQDGLFRSMPVMDGASEQLWRLSDADIHIRVVTYRLSVSHGHAYAAGDTVASLDRHNIPYRDLCFVADKTQVDCDIYLDDAPHNIEALRAVGRYAIVFDAPYNQHVPGPRARNWTEAADLVLARQQWLQQTGRGAAA